MNGDSPFVEAAGCARPTWTERGARDATTPRAHAVWRTIVNEFRPPAIDAARIEELDAFIAIP